MNKKQIIIGTASLLSASLILIIIRASRPAKKLLRLASNYVGIKEDGQNAGFNNQAFETKIKKVGWTSGQDWCCYTVKVLLNDLAKGKALDFFNKNINGSTQLTWQNLQTKSKYHEILTKPQAGTFVFYQNKDNTSKGHVELIEKINKDGSYQVISGNSPFDNSSEQGIARKKRNKSGIANKTILGYLKIKKLK